jgi:CDP-diacylglycerol---serine O-phosphatidyltransferase
MNVNKNAHLRMSRILKLADFFTLANFICGLLSIFYTINHDFKTASLLIIAAVFMDFIDGRVARVTGSSNEFGKQLDSLSDAVSFGVAPAILGYGLGLNSYLAIIILVYFASCGVLRLARFNIINEKGFIGVPITVNGLLFPILHFILGGFNNYVLIVYVLMGLLMISTVKIRKI